MATITLTPMEQQLRREAREAVEQDIRREVGADAKRAIASAEDDAERRHRDALARYMKDTEADIDFRVEAESEARWQARRDAYVDRMETVKDRAELAEAKAATLEAGLRALATSIWPEEDKYRAVARHMAITELDLGALAPALALLGWRLGAKTTDSQHSVMLLMPPNGAKAVHLLARKRILPPGVGDDTMHEEVRIDAPAQ